MLVDPEKQFLIPAQTECRRVAEQIVEEIKVAISSHWPPTSIPGAPPAWRTGDLSRGYHVEDTEDGAEVANDVDYWVYLEYGTRHMAPRPHIRPAVELVRAREIR